MQWRTRFVTSPSGLFRDISLVAVVILFAVLFVPPVFCLTEMGPTRGMKAGLHQSCSRESIAGEAQQPADLRSSDGVLHVSLTVRSSLDEYGHTRYCYVDENGNESPTLRLQPGDKLVLVLKNEISTAGTAAPSKAPIVTHAAHHAGADACTDGVLSPVSTNLHFHGLAIPPVCHQDETLTTLLEPGSPAYEYRIEIPKDQPPGLYWYHPHVHGFTEEQVLGGASGALVIEGSDRAVPWVAGLPDRVFVIRDEKMPAASGAETLDPKRPTKQLSINHVRVPYPQYPPAIIQMKPSELEFWRVLNASADTYLDLQVAFGGQRQSLGLVALDGVPIRYGFSDAPTSAPQHSHIFLPPGARAEFVLRGPPAGVTGQLMTGYVYRGAADENMPSVRQNAAQPGVRIGQDDVDAARPLASIVAADTSVAPVLLSVPVAPAHTMVPLAAVRPIRKRTLYFSEKLVDPSNPSSATLFFITEEGHAPAIFDHNNPQSTITVHQGDVEDWTIENRSQESHAFHTHQLHFLPVGGRKVRWEESTLRDTIDLPAWDGFRAYPNVTVRMDFRDPRIVGTFPFHCHILQHVDGGMMGLIRVEPAQKELGH